MKIFRFDKAEVRQDSLTTTKEGYLRGTAVVTRTGVFNYLNTDGTMRKELRTKDEVFKQQSLDTMKNIPVTLEHPSEFVSSKNADQYSVGYTGEQVTHNDSQVLVNFTITNQDAVKAVKNGKRELSLGYEQDLRLEGGRHDGENFDAVQTNIEYNHLAIVDRGRAGRQARIKLDGYGDYAVQVIDNENPLPKVKTMLVKIYGVDHDLPEDKAKLILAQQKKDADEKADLQKSLSTEKARADNAQEQYTQIKEEEQKRADEAARKDFISSVTPVLGKEFKFDNLDDKAIKTAVIQKVHPKANIDGQDDNYINARFDVAMESFDQAKEGVNKQKGQMIQIGNFDGAGGTPGEQNPRAYRRDGREPLTGLPEDKVEDQRKKMDTVYINAWQNPTALLGKNTIDSVYSEFQSHVMG